MSERTVSLLTSTFASLGGWFLVGIGTFVISLVGLFILWPLSLLFRQRDGRFLHSLSQVWAQMISFLLPFWDIHVEGLERIEKGRAYVVVSNHQSMLDIMLLLAHLPLHFKFIAKWELFWIPFLGWHLALARYIPLKRGDPESGKACLAKAQEWLKKGVSVIFFPEGTRSPDGDIHEFKAGAFKAALEGKFDLLPMVIVGTREAIPKYSWRIKRRAPLCLKILEPVSMTNSSKVSLDHLRDETRTKIIKEFQRLKSLPSLRRSSTLKILTLNTWQERGPWQERWEIIFRGIEDFRPDIVAFQELFSASWAQEIQKQTGYPTLLFPKEYCGLALGTDFAVKSWGVTTLTKSPLEDYSRYALWAELDLKGQKLFVFNTHFSWLLEDGESRKKQASEVRELIHKKASQAEALLVGDLNSTRHSEEIGGLIGKGGFRDLFFEKHGHESGFTWDNRNPYAAGSQHKLPDRRIDFILSRGSGPLLKSLVSCECVFTQPNAKGIWASDHFGVLAEFKLKLK